MASVSDVGLTLLRLPRTCNPDACGGDNTNNSANNDDNGNDSGGNLTHANATQDLALIPYHNLNYNRNGI